MPEPHRRPVTVSVPATSANLGPGFDALGLSLGLYDEVDACVVDEGLDIEVVGEGAGEVAGDESHLVVRSMRTVFEVLGVEVPGLRLSCRNVIPHGRGLGSSAAAIVAGIRLAEALVEGPRLSDRQTMTLATSLEGHPDNVAACLFGGLTVSWFAADGPRTRRLEVSPGLRPMVFVPPVSLSTELARGLLPAQVSHHDACANAGRAALLVAALTSAPEDLFEATEDRLHQEYRRAAMPASLELVDGLRAAKVPAVVSGAGPSVLALGTVEMPVNDDAWLPPGWQAWPLRVDTQGARIDA